MRWAGSFLLMGALGWIGLSAAWELKRKTAVLHELVLAIERMERELEQTLRPLPELLADIGAGTLPPVSEFFLACARYARKPEPSFAVGWKEELKKLALWLDGRSFRCLETLGRGLGRYDEAGEKRLLQTALRELRECEEESRQNCRKYCKLYRTLGVTGGIFCVLLLL